MSNASILLLNLGVVFVLTTALWAVSVAIRDTSIVDVFWGSGFVLVTWGELACIASKPIQPRMLILGRITTIWGLRLSAPRLEKSGAWRGIVAIPEMHPRHHGATNFGWVSLITVFLLPRARSCGSFHCRCKSPRQLRQQGDWTRIDDAGV